jgi:rhamnosyltransferase
MTLKISIILPTLNAGSPLARLLTSLQEQTVASEIIVVDSSSSDHTARTAESHGALTLVIPEEDFDHGRTRNLAVAKSGGSILVFLTQDAVPESRYFLERLIEPLEQPAIAATYGRQVSRKNARPTEKFARLFNYPDVPQVKGRDDIPVLGIKTFFFSNVCSAIRRKEFEELGGFAENIIMNEDMLMAGKLILSGYKIAYVPDAAVIHSHDYSLRCQLKRYFDIGVFMKRNLLPLVQVEAGNEGVKFFTEELRFLFNNKKYIWFPYALCENAFKYLGFKLGLHHAFLPAPLRKMISMHSHYWSS